VKVYRTTEDAASRRAPCSSLLLAGFPLVVNWLQLVVWCRLNPKNSRILGGELEELVDITLDSELEELGTNHDGSRMVTMTSWDVTIPPPPERREASALKSLALE
jgi:hypothetical protein